MIVGDRNMMKAALTRGVLQIQLNLIELYTSNLNSIATQAALISSFEFTGIAETIYPTRQTSDVPLQTKLAYFYYGFITLGIVCGLFAVSQATIVTIYGPGTALSGETPLVMTTAVSNMRKQQDFVFKLCGVSVTCLFIACVCMEWARRPKGVSALITLVYITIYYFMVTEGRKAYLFFSSIKEGVGGYEEDMTQSQPSNSDKATIDNNFELSIVEEANRVRSRGEIWMRQTLSKGGHLILCYGVLERGKLDIYKSEEDFKKLADPVLKQPIQLWKYRLELDSRKFGATQTSISKALRGATTGQDEFSFATLLASDYDLKLAVQKYRFAFCPKVVSELAPLPVYEFMANDEQSYRLWIKSFTKVLNGYEGVTADPTLETTMRAEANIELAVSAASKGA